MFLIVLFLIVTLLPICLLAKTQNELWYIGVVSGGVLLLILLIIPANYYNTMESVSKFNATKQSISILRKNGDNYEKAALQNSIIECNRWLASAQFYRKGLFRFFVPKIVDEMKPIE